MEKKFKIQEVVLVAILAQENPFHDMIEDLLKSDDYHKTSNRCELNGHEAATRRTSRLPDFQYPCNLGVY